eukprot:170301-Prorocentrum_lima.AAC.1
MTSSLVGSEMCIRDRCWPLHGCSAPAGTTRRALQPLWRLRAVGYASRPCLLYTSDAADDM